MKYYIEITLNENSEYNLFTLWSKVYQQIHIGLVEMQDEKGNVPIGISFPEYVNYERFNLLGSKIRLFANNLETLVQFDSKKRLEKLTEYLNFSEINQTPEIVKGYVQFQREQPKINPERLARRYAKRHNVEYEIALKTYEGLKKPNIKSPFIRLKSLSTAQVFCLWIQKNSVSEPKLGSFNSYGLSTSSSVPEF
jgi:CRISPR-associated endonuclease Csy4